MFYSTSNSSCNFFIENTTGSCDYRFILQTMHDELRKCPDPWDKSLTVGEKIHIIDECIQNPYFFFREVLRYEDRSRGVVPFMYNKGVVAQIYLHFNEKSSTNMCCRQSFKTGTSYALFIYDFLFKTNYKMLLQERSINDCKLGFTRIRKLLSILPNYILRLTGDKLNYGTLTIVNEYSRNRIDVGGSPAETPESYISCAKNASIYDFVEISDMPASNNFKYYYENILPLIASKRMLVNINTIDFENESIDMLVNDSHKFDDKMYSDKSLMKDHDIYFIHYPYADLMSSECAESLKRSLCWPYDDSPEDDERVKVFNREMCVRFD